MSEYRNDILIGKAAVARLMESQLSRDAADYIHPSWLSIKPSDNSISRLSRSLLVSKYLVISELDNITLSKEIDFGFYKRFIREPNRYLILAGLCSTLDSEKFAQYDGLSPETDKNFAQNLGLALSMNKRFETSSLIDLTLTEIGVHLFCKNLGAESRLVWELCKLAVEKNIVRKINIEEIGEPDIHTSAISKAWNQIDHYIRQQQEKD